jgi:SCP-2 sterol transfer family
MSDPLRPPPGLSAPTFFESWLPDAFTRSGRRGLATAPAVRVTLSGEGGGDWRVQAGEEGLEVTSLKPGRHEGVDVWLRQSAADFLAAFTPEPDLPELLPAGWTALDLLFLDERDVALLDQMSGRIALEISGKRRRRWTLDLAFAKEGVNAGRARATVQIDAATYDGLRTKTVAPMQALLGGKVKIEGDRNLAMKALLLVAQRLAR